MSQKLKTSKFSHRRNKPIDSPLETPRESFLPLNKQKLRNSTGAAEMVLPNIFRQSLNAKNNGSYRKSMNLEMAEYFLHQYNIEAKTVKNEETTSNLKETLNGLKEKLAKAKAELSKPATDRLSIRKENDEYEEENNYQQLKLNAFLQDDHCRERQEEESTFNLESQNKLQFLMKSKEELINLPKIKAYYLCDLAKAIQGNHENALEHLQISMKVLKNFSKIQSPSQDYLLQKKVNLQTHEKDKNKKTLLLDLDETLIHCSQERESEKDIEVPISLDNGSFQNGYISIRPYAITFLKRISKLYQVIAFTASHQSYADVVLDEIDPDRELIRHRLYRQHCIQIHDNIYAKDLRIINRSVKTTVLVDNAPYSYIYQLQNGIPILPYYSGEDQELPALEKYLEQLVKCDDVREINKKTFKLHKYAMYDSEHELVKDLYYEKK